MKPAFSIALLFIILICYGHDDYPSSESLHNYLGDYAKADILPSKEKIVTMVILLDFNVMEYESFYKWFQGIESNITFILLHWESLNSTQITWLKSHAELIPGITNSQEYNTTIRALIADHVLQTWKNTFGSHPRGIFSFQPDTFLVNCARDK